MTTCVMVIRCHHGTSAAKSGSSSRRRARMLSSIDSPSRSGWPSSRLPPAAGGASPNGLDVVGIVGAAPNGLAGGAAPNGLAGVVVDEDDDVVSVSAPNGLLNASSDVALSSEAASSESRSGAAKLCSFAFACSFSFDSGEGSSADDVSSPERCCRSSSYSSPASSSPSPSLLLCAQLSDELIFSSDFFSRRFEYTRYVPEQNFVLLTEPVSLRDGVCELRFERRL